MSRRSGLIGLLVLTAAMPATLSSVPAAASRAQRADLVVASVSAPPAAAAAGTSFELRVAVRNKGAKRARSSRPAFYLSLDQSRSRGDLRLGGELSQRRTKTLKPRRRWRAVGRVAVPATAPAGSYYLLVCADVTRRVKERKESNNCRASQARVVVPAPASPPVPPPTPAPTTTVSPPPSTTVDCPELPPGEPPPPGTSCGGSGLPPPPPGDGGGGGNPLPP